jgi:hypothetical protein
VNNCEPFVCERQRLLRDHECKGRITREHALYYAGRKIDEAWAIVLLCEYAHNLGPWLDGGILDKSVNQWIAVNRAPRGVSKRYPRLNWTGKKRYLNQMFGAFPRWGQLPRR